jgi:hypothetical protein
MTTSTHIFVSYSRKDSSIVGPLVQFLRISASQVFRDVDNIPPGAEWQAVLADAIQDCGTFLLFWCCHSSRSQEVRKAVEQALSYKKPIVPVLLDNTELAPDIRKYHGIDLRIMLGNHEGFIEHEIPSLMPGSGKTERHWGLIQPSNRNLLSGCVHLKRELTEVLGIGKTNKSWRH